MRRLLTQHPPRDGLQVTNQRLRVDRGDVGDLEPANPRARRALARNMMIGPSMVAHASRVSVGLNTPERVPSAMIVRTMRKMLAISSSV